MRITGVLGLLLVISIANGTPVLAAKLFGSAFAWPVDFGLVLPDGHRMLGSSKTIRGLVCGLLAACAAAIGIGLGWRIGVLAGATALAGDLLSSFTKRRLGMPPSSKATGLDQIPESLLPFLACMPVLGFTFLEVALGVLLFFTGEPVLSKFLYKIHVRDTAY